MYSAHLRTTNSSPVTEQSKEEMCTTCEGFPRGNEIEMLNNLSVRLNAGTGIRFRGVAQ